MKLFPDRAGTIIPRIGAGINIPRYGRVVLFPSRTGSIIDSYGWVILFPDGDRYHYSQMGDRYYHSQIWAGNITPRLGRVVLFPDRGR